MQNEEELRALLSTLDPEELEELARSLAKPADLASLAPKRPRVEIRSKVTGCFDLSRVDNAAQAIRKLPGKDQSTHFLMAGRFAAADLIPAVQSLAGAKIDELYVATLGFSKANVDQFASLMDDGLVGRFTLLCSAYFKDTEGTAFDYGQQQLEARGARLCKSRNHAKVILFRFGQRHYIVEASANIRSCLSLEQVAVFQSRPLFRFHRQWMEGVLTTEAAP